MSITYVILRSIDKRLQIIEDIPAGMIVWAFTDGSSVPALGLQGKF
jgi:hypothetical protein